MNDILYYIFAAIILGIELFLLATLIFWVRFFEKSVFKKQWNVGITIIAITFAIFLGLFFRGDEGYIDLVFGFLKFVTLPIIIILVGCYIYREKISDKTKADSYMLIHIVIFSLAQLIGVGIGEYLKSQDIAEAKEFCMEIFEIQKDKKISPDELKKKVATLEQPKNIRYTEYEYIRKIKYDYDGKDFTCYVNYDYGDRWAYHDYLNKYQYMNHKWLNN